MFFFKSVAGMRPPFKAAHQATQAKTSQKQCPFKPVFNAFCVGVAGGAILTLDAAAQVFMPGPPYREGYEQLKDAPDRYNFEGPTKHRISFD